MTLSADGPLSRDTGLHPMGRFRVEMVLVWVVMVPLAARGRNGQWLECPRRPGAGRGFLRGKQGDGEGGACGPRGATILSGCHLEHKPVVVPLLGADEVAARDDCRALALRCDWKVTCVSRLLGSHLTVPVDVG